MNWRILVATVLLVAGGAIEVLAVVGLCAMRDLYDRMHFVGLVGYGALLIAVAIVFRESFSLIGDKALLVGVDGDRQLILAHQLRPTGGRETIDPLELG